MTIGKKLNLLIIGIIVVLLIGILTFVLIYLPTNLMRVEKDSLFELDSAISELRADINKMTRAPFAGAVETVVKDHDNLAEQFNKLDEVEVLKHDPKINEALNIMLRLNSLFEVNYEDLVKKTELVTNDMTEVFYSSNVILYDIRTSQLLQRSAKRNIVESNIDTLFSSISIIDSNLISTHNVVQEQFEIINGVTKAREMHAYRTGLIVIALAVVFSLIAAFLVASRIVASIRTAGEGIKQMSGGDISFSFDIKSKDEVGELGQNLNTLIQSLKEAFDSMKKGSTEGVTLKEELISSSNETSAAAAEIATTSRAIETQFGTLTDKVNGASVANGLMKDSIQHLEEYVLEQNTMVEESTASVTEMISSINNVADITAKKRAATENLVKTATSGGEKLNTTTREINQITENLDEIKGMATIIQQIASQTNLLAMNAAIEAAHAGEAGRGFAVVADEIRKLAEASSLNSKKISGVLKEVVSRIESASESSLETQEAFKAIDTEVGGVSRSLEEIKSSMDELNVGGKQILEAMTGLQDVSVRVGQGSSDMKEASQKVTEAIEVVSRITSEVANSASEINVGINEVSNAMTLVTDLSNKLGSITDQLEVQAGNFKTESDYEDEDSAENEPGDNGKMKKEDTDAGHTGPESSDEKSMFPDEMNLSVDESESVTVADDKTDYDYEELKED